MGQLTSSFIRNYRGLKNVHFDELNKVNLFVGENNSGKTSILEAIQLMSNPLSIREFRTLSRMRERYIIGRAHTSPEELVSWLFPLNKDKQHEDIGMEVVWDGNQIRLKCSLEEEDYIVTGLDDASIENNDSKEYFFFDETVTKLTVNVEVEQNGEEMISEKHVFNEVTQHPQVVVQQKERLFLSSFISSVDHRFLPLSPFLVDELIKSGDRPKLIEALRFFDPEISGIELLMDKGSPKRTSAIPYIQHNTLGLVPISTFGDGLRKALLIATRVIRSRGSLLLIDELETGIHTKLIPRFFEWMIQMCKEYDVQIFATTHSLEAVDGMLQANMDQLNSLSVYRLESERTGTKVRHFTGEQLSKLRYKLGQDVR